MTSWVMYLTIINLIVIIAGAIGGYLAYRAAFSRAKDEITERVTGLLKTENEVLQRRVKTVEGRLRLLINWFAKQGVVIEFDGESLTIRDTKNGITSVHQSETKPRESEKEV